MVKAGEGIGLDGGTEIFYPSHVKFEKEINYPRREVIGG